MKEEYFLSAVECKPKVPFDRILKKYAHNEDEAIRMRRAMWAVVQTIVHHGRKMQRKAQAVTT